MTKKTVYDSIEDLYCIAKALQLAKDFTPGLDVEVMWSAMTYLKDHPNITISQACEYGLNEWVK